MDRSEHLTWSLNHRRDILPLVLCIQRGFMHAGKSFVQVDYAVICGASTGDSVSPALEANHK